MKKALVLILALGLLVSLVAIVGCGDDKQTIKTPEGEVTVEEDGGTITFEGEGQEGTIDITDEPPTEDELGAPIYPGAEYVEGSGGTMSGTSEEGEFSTAGAEFTTGDSFDEVVAWYTDELGEPTYLGSGGYEEATWMIGDEETEFIVVTITVESGDTMISIGRMSGTVPE